MLYGEGASLTKPASFGGRRHSHVYDELRCLPEVHLDGPQHAWGACKFSLKSTELQYRDNLGYLLGV